MYKSLMKIDGLKTYVINSWDCFASLVEVKCHRIVVEINLTKLEDKIQYVASNRFG